MCFPLIFFIPIFNPSNFFKKYQLIRFIRLTILDKMGYICLSRFQYRNLLTPKSATNMKVLLTKENIGKVHDTFSNHPHFSEIIHPRLKILNNIKKELKDYPDLEWSFNYDHVNMHNNHVQLQYLPCRGTDFTFFFQIPLIQGFEFRLFLGTSSVHFIDLYNYLINNNLIAKNDYPIKAEYRTIPHFILNGNTKRYQMKTLNQVASPDHGDKVIDEHILSVIESELNKFIPILKHLLQNLK